MKSALGLVACATLIALPAMADEVAPSDVVFNDGMVENSLTGAAGDATTGRDVFSNRKLGNCLACHSNSDMPELSFHGEVAPLLDGVADRWSQAQLRGIVANAKMTFEDTMMPAFYIDSGYVRPLEDFDGKSILSAQQVEDVVSYLMTLKEE